MRKPNPTILDLATRTQEIPLVEGQEPTEIEFDPVKFNLFHSAMLEVFGEYYWKLEKRSLTLKEFADEVESESWNGLSTAFRNGIKCRITGQESNYLFRRDFQDAWLRGYDAADKFIASGSELKLNPTRGRD